MPTLSRQCKIGQRSECRHWINSWTTQPWMKMSMPFKETPRLFFTILPKLTKRRKRRYLKWTVNQSRSQKRKDRVVVYSRNSDRLRWTLRLIVQTCRHSRCRHFHGTRATNQGHTWHVKRPGSSNIRTEIKFNICLKSLHSCSCYRTICF